MNYTLKTILTLSLLAITMTTACVGEEEGKDEKLRFTYSGGSSLSSLEKQRLAPGAKLDIRISDINSDQKTASFKLTSANSSDTATLTVPQSMDDRLTVEAVKEGVAELSVQGTLLPSQADVEDAIDIQIAAPEVLNMGHRCWAAENTSKRPKYVTGSVILLDFNMALADGTNVIGYGYYPVVAEPATSASVIKESNRNEFIPLQASDVEGPFTLKSTVNDETLDLELISPAKIEGIDLSAESVTVGETDSVIGFYPTVGGQQLCRGTDKYTITSLSPEVCTVKKPDTEFLLGVGVSELFMLDALSSGTCEVEFAFLGPKGEEASKHKVSLVVMAP